jgi:hypothetical protein
MTQASKTGFAPCRKDHFILPKAAVALKLRWTSLFDQVAAVLTYIRNSWGNGAAPVSASVVASQRESLAKFP